MVSSCSKKVEVMLVHEAVLVRETVLLGDVVLLGEALARLIEL